MNFADSRLPISSSKTVNLNVFFAVIQGLLLHVTGRLSCGKTGQNLFSVAVGKMHWTPVFGISCLLTIRREECRSKPWCSSNKLTSAQSGWLVPALAGKC